MRFKSFDCPPIGRHSLALALARHSLARMDLDVLAEAEAARACATEVPVDLFPQKHDPNVKASQFDIVQRCR